MEEFHYDLRKGEEKNWALKRTDPIERIEGHLGFDTFWSKIIAAIKNGWLGWDINYRLASFLKRYFRLTSEDLLATPYFDIYLKRVSSFATSPLSRPKSFDPIYCFGAVKYSVGRKELNREEAIYLLKMIACFRRIKIL